LITSSLSVALSKFFSDKKDKTKQINICIPANIRWEMYATKEKVKMENKFAPVQMVLPIESDLGLSLK
jgi:hypothetical protein